MKDTEFEELVHADFLVMKPGGEQGTQSPHSGCDPCSGETMADSLVCIVIIQLHNCH